MRALVYDEYTSNDDFSKILKSKIYPNLNHDLTKLFSK
uniref:Uncharacterized protein n=1 Tax=uncultured marine thaumarchaeote SAT1000_10_G09 TaxID=1456375 RepID=A0A075I489_9ARCH|nr:hypothetical protein [uncultured marine thaumarchaeote SAT1000_10_G09]